MNWEELTFNPQPCYWHPPPGSYGLHGASRSYCWLHSLGPLAQYVGYLVFIIRLCSHTFIAAGAYTASQWHFSCTEPMAEYGFSGTFLGCDEAKAAAGFSFLIFFARELALFTLLIIHHLIKQKIYSKLFIQTLLARFLILLKTAEQKESTVLWTKEWFPIVWISIFQNSFGLKH